ncbi:sensor histidine kinase [Companilactobacillus mishanensis]|uniref:histidine kinase n=1 Tax=Companilactobacillus mishanensis TaxID=2486008 RepID=A0ABW9P5E2_9LACO|nr:HAMP domain-containing sensor histidine kinase [Companilactobacillus mishanensis]MQS44470.1 HAMP domain-containing histidine kinase [Companilactobacillus mishanensis]MQS88713.1 HAMP domain-containing histidine kinase [Companilactobacillus mishanensis]
MRISIRVKWTSLISAVILAAYLIVAYVAYQTVDNVASASVAHGFYIKLIWVGIIVVIAGIAVSFAAVTMVLRNIKAINETIDDLNKKPDSDSRIKLRKRNDEIYDLTININKMLDRMQAYTNQQKEFVEDVSHELRTPVAVLEGHLSMLQRWGKDDPEVLNDSINSSLQELKRMQSLIQEMLDLTRVEQIDNEYLSQTTEVKPLFKQVYNDFKMLHPDFVVNYDDDIQDGSEVRIYRNHLEQVLVILLDNAFKYSGDRKEINLAASTNEALLEIVVQDYGVGIAKNDLKRVFNRFYRVDKARSRKRGGNGLGLSIASRLIEIYKGTITVESVVGSGTVFRIELPIVQDGIDADQESDDTNSKKSKRNSKKARSH